MVVLTGLSVMRSDSDLSLCHESPAPLASCGGKDRSAWQHATGQAWQTLSLLVAAVIPPQHNAAASLLFRGPLGIAQGAVVARAR